MPDREKVMKGLEYCIDINTEASCCECPYYNHERCDPDDVLRDALALLKAQEPRVLTREEVLALPEGAVVWFEERSDDSRDYIGPLVSDGNGFFGDFGRGVDMHAVELKRQRCWTSRPTLEQMRDTPWKETAMPNEGIKLKPCPRCGGEAAYRGHYSLHSIGTMWVASVWCRECYVCIERMVSKREIDLANLSDSEMIKNITKEKAIEAWNALAKEDSDAE